MNGTASVMGYGEDEDATSALEEATSELRGHCDIGL